MSRKSFIDSVRVGKPCSETWEQMEGNDQVRFCSHCAKDVKNLSAITRKQAARLVLASDGKICIRYVKNPITEEPIYSGQLLQITRRSPALAAGIVSASLAMSTMGYAQSAPSVPEPNAPVVTSQSGDPDYEEPSADKADADDDPAPGSIEGFILDASGMPVPGVTLMIAGPEAGADYATTDAQGKYRFDELDAGTHVLRIASSTGTMKKALRGIEVAAGQKLFQNIHVTVAQVEKGEGGSGTGWGFSTGGAVAYIPYDLELNRAVAANDVAEVRRLLSAGESVSGKDKNYNGITPLFLAVEGGSVEITRLLLGRGADVNATDNSNRTPLMSLDSDATAELVGMLLAAGARVNARDEDGRSVLLNTIGSVNANVLDALIKGGADINEADDRGETVLMKAAEKNDLELVKTPVEAGAKVNEKDDAGESAWDKTSDTEIEQVLEAHGAVADYSTIEVIPAVADDEETADTDTDEPVEAPEPEASPEPSIR